MKNHGLRILRGWIGALVCTCLAAASHTMADGHLPPLPILGILLCISAVLCTALASKGISLPRTGLAVVLSQGAYHGAFGLFGHRTPAPGPADVYGGHAGHAAQRLEMVLNQTTEAAGSGDTSTPLLMLLLHLAGSMLTIWTLCRGEIAVRALAAAVSLSVPRLILSTRGPRSLRGKQPLLGVAYRSLVLRDVLRPVLHRRGPPRGPAFASP